MRDNKINQKRPGIETLTFMRFPALAKEIAVTFEYNNGDSASETGKADKVNPDGYLHMFLVRYFLKDDEHYVLLTRDQFEDLSFLVKHAGSFWHYAEDGVAYKW